MIRAFTIGLMFLAAAAADSSPALAAPGSFAVSGDRAKACGLSATSVGLTVSNVNNVYTTTFAPASVTAWCNTAGTLSVSSTHLVKTGATSSANYTLSVDGWGSTMTYTTANTPPAATTQSSATRSTTLSFTCSVSTHACTGAPFAKNTNWTATITLALTPN